MFDLSKFSTWYVELIRWFGHHGLRVIIIVVLALVLERFAAKVIVRVVRRVVTPSKYHNADDELKRENTLIRIFSWVSRIAIYLLAVLMVLQEMGIPIGPLMAGAGIVGIAVGFGGQYLIRDVISGFFIIMENQYRIGDSVSLDGTSGMVEDISLRMTTLRNLDGAVHHVPHGEIKRVSNMSKDFARVNINIGVAYESDIEHVISVVNRVGNDLAQDEEWKMLIKTPPQFLRIDEFGDSSIVIKIVGDTEALANSDVAGELRKRLKIAFDKNGISIPYPQRVIRQQGPREKSTDA